ncbi:LPS assembly protein LptD [bacterium]|nr:LPS assembly protein LptD [bacterium]
MIVEEGLSRRCHFRSVVFAIFSFFSVYLLLVSAASAQVQPPDNEFLFREDSDQAQERLSRQREVLMGTGSAASRQSSSDKIDFSAPSVEFDKAENVISGSGGVLVSGQGLRLQGETGSVDLDTNDVVLKRRVLITGEGNSIQADEVEFNLDTEAGTFTDARFTLEDGAYGFQAERAKKLNDTEFELEDCFLSTCHCPDGDTPWVLSGTRVSAEKEGYAHAYNSVFRFQGVPLFYTPWIAVPIKQERSSGLLVPQFGYSNRDGFTTRLPFYGVIDGSSDMVVAPFLASRTRRGLQLDYREAYSTRSSFEGRAVYSDESPRDGDLRGTDITGVAEPEIDDDRLGLYVKQNWRNSSSADVPLSLVSDVHWVSDTLFLREIEDADIGLASSRYATSRVALRSQLSDFVSSSVIGEWNENLVGLQDTTLQRLPQLNLTASRSYRPFGFNPYGLKVTPKFEVNGVRFQRETGYDGTRLDFNPSLRVPFHYKNFFNSEFTFAYHQTMYDLDDVSSLDGSADLDDSSDRGLFRFNYEVRTALEKVYDLPEENILSTLTSLGTRSQSHRLQRVKHTIEPRVSFAYVPDTDQENLPLFDSFDRIRNRSLITYELRTRLLGSFDYFQGATNDIEEFTEEVDDLSPLDTLSPLTDFDVGSSLPGSTFGVPLVAPARGRRQIRELANFRLVQNYDYIEDQEDLDPERGPFSDVGAQLYLTPTQDFGFGAGTNYDVEGQDVSSWQLASHLYDDRGDSIRARYTYVDENISQVEGNVELVLSSQFKLGYYARFDERESEFIEQQAALRFSSSCDCWHIDLGFTEEINPNRERVLFRFTLKGLGDLTQNFGFEDRGDESLQP